MPSSLEPATPARPNRARHLVIAAVVASLLGSAASADTLREALVDAYRTNPTLTAQREAQKGNDANVAIARAAGRPQVGATIGVSRDITLSGINRLSSAGKGPYLSGGLNVSYPLFNGGAVKSSIAAAKLRDQAGLDTLLGVEGDVFTAAVTAYMDVIRDRAVVELNANNVKVLQTNLRATSDRFKIGDLTRTDVAQSQARLSLSQSQYAAADAQRRASEERYRSTIGHAPGELKPPPPLPPLPATADEAVQIAIASNPDLLAIGKQGNAAGYDVRGARASRLPSVSAVGSANYTNTLGPSPAGIPRSGTVTTLGVQGNIPLFQGGLPAARIRQAQAVEGQLLEQQIGTERAVVATTQSAFALYRASLDAIASNEVAVKADELALQGARAENSVGTRTILDVLNAEQELLNAQVALVTARHDAYVAGFQLLNAMGQAQAGNLGLDGGALYDPLGNYRRVAGSASDWSSDPRHTPVATRTLTPQETPAAMAPKDVTATPR